ncbi:MAG: NADH-quinone oxidoreductase subunit N [Abditibacteriaceae bacterium]
MNAFPLTLEEVVRSYNVMALLPLIVLFGFALAVLLAGAFFSESNKKWILPILALVGAVISALTCLPLWGQSLVFGVSGHALFAADNFSLLFNSIFLMVLIITLLMSHRFLSAREGDVTSAAGEFYGLLMLSAVGMMIVAGSRDLLAVFLGIETLSIAVYVLAGFARRSLNSNEASLKYFLLGAFATGFLLYGIAMTYLATGTTNLSQISLFVRSGFAGGAMGASTPIIYYAGLGLLLIGLGFKAALVPFHQWAPDVYEGAPTPVSAFMATAVKAAAFAAILRVFPEMIRVPAIAAHWQTLVLIICVLTMTIGNVIAIMQTSLKRMLAYSSVAHAGYALIGLVTIASAVGHSMTMSINAAFSGVIFYLIVYALMTLGAFAVLVYFEQELKPGQNENVNLTLDDIRGIAVRHPWAAAALTLFLFSLAGIPPTAGFFAKLYIFLPAVKQGLIGLVIVAVLNSVISVYYYFRPMVYLYSGKDENVATDISVSASGEAVASGRSIGVAVAIGICAVAVVLMFALQGVLLPLLQTALPQLML